MNKSGEDHASVTAPRTKARARLVTGRTWGAKAIGDVRARCAPGEDPLGAILRTLQRRTGRLVHGCIAVSHTADEHGRAIECVYLVSFAARPADRRADGLWGEFYVAVEVAAGDRR